MLNYERVQNLREEIGEDDFEEVVALFLEEADEAIERLEPDVGAQQLETDFHALKGSALNLGFDRFAEICATAEKQAAEGTVAEIDFQTPIDAYSAAKSELLAHLQTTAAA